MNTTVAKQVAHDNALTYLVYAIRAATPKKARMFKKPASPSTKRTLVIMEEGEPESAKKVKKAPAKAVRSKGIDFLSEVTLLKEAQLKKALKRSKRETSIYEVGCSSDGADFESEVPDKPQGKLIDTSEGTGLKLGVPDVSKADSSKREYESWGDSGDEANIQAPTTAEATTLTIVVPDSETLTALHQRIIDLKKDVKELKDVDNSRKVISTIKPKVLNAIKEYIRSTLDEALYNVIQRNFADIIKEHSVPAKIVERLGQKYALHKSIKDIQNIKIEHARKHQVPKETITSSDTLEEFDQKTTLFEPMTKSNSFNKSLKNRALYHALMESILKDEEAMDEGVAEKLKKRKPDDADKDEGLSGGSDQGFKIQRIRKGTKTLNKTSTTKDSSKGKSLFTSSKSSKSGKSAKDQVEELIFVQDSDYTEHNNADMPRDQGKNLGKINKQPHDEAVPKNDWYKKSDSDTSPDPK
nr:hypothetical protein [Tanacetum cinerariifolium]